jgi:hypothetical protein
MHMRELRAVALHARITAISPPHSRATTKTMLLPELRVDLVDKSKCHMCDGLGRVHAETSVVATPHSRLRKTIAALNT